MHVQSNALFIDSSDNSNNLVCTYYTIRLINFKRKIKPRQDYTCVFVSNVHTIISQYFGVKYVLCYVVLCYVVLCYVVLCYVVMCYVVLCYVVLCYGVLFSVVLCSVVLCSVVLCYVVMCLVVLC